VPPLAAYNDRPALSVRSVCPLYFPPSAAIAFTSIGFYIATFSACETSRSPKPPSVASHDKRERRRATRGVARGGGKKKRKKKKESKNDRLAARDAAFHIDLSPPPPPPPRRFPERPSVTIFIASSRSAFVKLRDSRSFAISADARTRAGD